jgi:hypothetical protein
MQSFSCKDYILEVTTCPTKTTYGAYYGEVRLSKLGHVTRKKSISVVLTRTSSEVREPMMIRKQNAYIEPSYLDTEIKIGHV